MGNFSKNWVNSDCKREWTIDSIGSKSVKKVLIFTLQTGLDDIGRGHSVVFRVGLTPGSVPSYHFWYFYGTK